jgi:hypothetical protein
VENERALLGPSRIEVLVALDSKQRVFAEVVRDYLERIIYSTTTPARSTSR